MEYMLINSRRSIGFLDVTPKAQGTKRKCKQTDLMKV